MDEFLKLAREVHKDRVNEEFNNKKSIVSKVNTLHSMFSIWCRVFEKDINAYKTFTEYVKEQEPGLEFGIKKAFLEKYYDFEFEYNYETKKWKIKNLNREI